MNTPTTVAPVRDAIPIRPTRRLQGSGHLIRPALAATLLCLCLLPLGEARAVADTGPRVAPITSVGGVMGVSTDAESRDEAKALMESDCVTQVRQSTASRARSTTVQASSVGMLTAVREVMTAVARSAAKIAPADSPRAEVPRRQRLARGHPSGCGC